MRSIEKVDVAKSGSEDEKLHGRNVDGPKSGSQFDSDTIRVAGWIVGRSSRVSVVGIVHDGTILQKASVDVRHARAHKLFPDVAGAEKSGFRTTVEVPASPEFDLVMLAVLQDGDRAPLGTIRVRGEPEVAEAPPDDTARKSSGPLARLLRRVFVG